MRNADPSHLVAESKPDGSKSQPECSQSNNAVYLRPEQNIPDSFSTKFKPIAAAAVNGGAEESKGELCTSSQDIVLTLRSVQV